MSSIDQIPPDQRAALALLLTRRKRYSEVASLLGIEPRALHDRAHAALAVLSPALARNVAPQLRERIGEYLLGQQREAEERVTKAQLASSPPAREWARAVAVELMRLTAEPLPEIPSGSLSRSSRRGGAMLLSGIALIVVAVVVVLVATGGGSGSSPAHQAASTHRGSGSTHAASKRSGSTGSGSGAEATPQLEKQINLKATSLGGSAVGLVVVAGLEGKHAVILSTEHLPPTSGFKYFLWLVSTEGKVAPHPFELPSVGKSEHVSAGGALPSDASSFNEMELTKEIAKHPTSPSSEVLLEAPFSFH